MALTQVTGPYPIFTDLDGSPLDDGYLYIGAANQDPETNPIQVFWDSALTIPATQPIRTNNGYAWRNGTPGLLYAAGEFSITIRNKRNEFVLYSPLGYGFDPKAASASIIKNDFIGDGVQTDYTISAYPSTILATNIFINGVYQEKDSYSIIGNVITFSIAPPLNSSIEILTNESGVINSGNATDISYTLTAPGAVGQTVQTRLEQYVSVKDFGAIGDGVADDTAAIQAALDAASNVTIPLGTYKISTSLLPNSDTTLVIEGVLYIPFHAYTAIRIDGKSNVKIIGSGAIQGYGNFPPKNISGVSGGEKHLTTSYPLTWPQGTNGNVTALGAYGGGYLGNGGHGIFILGSSNVTVNVEIFGFNYSGVTIGDPTDNNNPAAVVSSNISVSGYIHDCYNSGITYSCCENVIISDLILYNIGHPDVVISDPIIDPGYGTTSLSMGANGIAAKHVTQTGITANLCKRRGIDIHSGYFISTGNCTINQSWIAGVGGMVGGGYHGNLTFSNINISNSANATTVTADAPIAFAIGSPFSIASDINIYESARSYGVYVYANNISLSNFVLNNPTYTALNRPFYAINVTNLEVDGFRIRGTFNDSILLSSVTISTLNNINTQNTSWTTGQYDLEMITCSVYIGAANTWSRRQFNIGNTGHMEGRRARVSFSCNGTVTPDYTIVDGEAYIGSVSFVSNYAYIYAIANTAYTGITDGAGLGAFSVRTDIGTVDEVKSVNTFAGRSGGAVYAATGLFKDNTTRAAFDSANLNGTGFVTDIFWAFQ